jgi:DNA-binding transcriptional ArsR family regulator
MGHHRLDEESELDRLFHALSEQKRRRIVVRLAQEGSLTVGELQDSLDVAKSTLSKHLKILERAGLLRRSVLGRFHICHPQAKALVVAQRWLGRTAARGMRRRRA